MSSSTPIADVLASLEASFRQQGVRWYLFGAQAVVLWGRPRTSVDIDVTVHIALESVPEFIRSLADAGFELRIHSDVDDFVARTRVLPFVHASSRTPVDVVLAGPGLEEQFLDRSVRVALGEIEIPVISPEDLIVTKVLAGRPRDIEDVRGILAERSTSLDVEQIRTTLRLVEEALGQNDLTPLLEAELQRTSPRA